MATRYFTKEELEAAALNSRFGKQGERVLKLMVEEGWETHGWEEELRSGAKVVYMHRGQTTGTVLPNGRFVRGGFRWSDAIAAAKMQEAS